MSQAIIRLLIEDAAFYDAQMNEIKLKQFADALKDVSPIELGLAIKHFRMQPGRRTMPMPADYLQAIPDGHPSAQEAWSMIPRDESKSVVWSEEMRKAYAVAAQMISDGEISSAFFAFKETYEKLIAESKSLRRKPKWSPSFGHDVGGRDAAIIDAIDKGRISLEYAVKIRPELEYHPNYPSLAYLHGRGSMPQIEASSHINTEGISKIRDLLKLPNENVSKQNANQD